MFQTELRHISALQLTEINFPKEIYLIQHFFREPDLVRPAFISCLTCQMYAIVVGFSKSFSLHLWTTFEQGLWTNVHKVPRTLIIDSSSSNKANCGKKKTGVRFWRNELPLTFSQTVVCSMYRLFRTTWQTNRNQFVKINNFQRIANALRHVCKSAFHTLLLYELCQRLLKPATTEVIAPHFTIFSNESEKNGICQAFGNRLPGNWSVDQTKDVKLLFRPRWVSSLSLTCSANYRSLL